MINRQLIECDTCGQLHVTRTGFGRSNRQEHRFSCRGCELEIGFALNLDQAKGQHEYVDWFNCHPVEGEPFGPPIVNLDADFLVPAELQGVDFAFPRLQQYREAINAREAAGTLAWESERPLGARGGNLLEEWEELRRAWLLDRNRNGVLSRAKVKASSDKYYPTQALTGLPDWLFRFIQFVGGEPIRQMFEQSEQAVSALFDAGIPSDLVLHYEQNMASHRGRIYLDAFNAYFGAYSDLSQVRIRVAAGLAIEPGMEVSSRQFDRTKMLYGSLFENLGSLVELIAYLNNVLVGRRWDEFETLSRDQYLRLDKSARFGPFAANADLAILVAERDNQLRNASHHGGIEIDPKTGLISYRAGKGGQGAAQSMSYTIYLEKCTTIFNQILVIFMLDLRMARDFKIRPI